jgi:dihydroorotase
MAGQFGGLQADMDRLELTRPDDWHLHVRDGNALGAVVPHTARVFGRAIIMPNLQPPVTTVDQALAYRDRILSAVPKGSGFEPLMTLYLTDDTPPKEIRRAADGQAVHAIKLYPAGATTHSDAGVTAIGKTYAALEAMAEADLPLLVHGEVTRPEVDVFDREAVFIDEVLAPLVDRIEGLRIVFEHITTRRAVEFVQAAPDRVAATITAHHLLENRNALFHGGLRPHYYCLPVLKRETDREALLQAASSGSRKFFLGTDSAPHLKDAKESACGCAGIYTAHAAMELYAEAFDSIDALHRLEGFASHHGADFYRLPRNLSRIVLERRETIVPDNFPFGDGSLVPLRAGGQIGWQCHAAEHQGEMKSPA